MLKIVTFDSFSLQSNLNHLYYHFEGKTQFPVTHENM